MCVCVCVGRRGSEGFWGSHVFRLTSPETIRQPARFVPKVNKSDSDLTENTANKIAHTKAHNAYIPHITQYSLYLSVYIYGIYKLTKISELTTKLLM